MLALHGGLVRDAHELEISPNLWAGVGLVRGGAGTALVGSHAEVADRIEEYHASGIEQFILSGYPHLEEAYWFAEGVMPLLRERGLLDAASGSAGWGRPRLGAMDEAAWGALALALTLLGGIYTWVSSRRRGLAAGVRGAGLTLLPVAAWLTGSTGAGHRDRRRDRGLGGRPGVQPQHVAPSGRG